MATPEQGILRVSAEDHRLRLDRFLRKSLPDLSRGRIERMLRTGMVRVNGRPRTESYFVKEGDQVAVEEPASLHPRDPVRLIHASEHILVVGKPPGLPTNPVAAGRASLLTEASLIVEGGTLGVLHRLDAETSGVVMLSRSPVGQRTIESLFRRGAVRKRYAAVSVGSPGPDHGFIDAPLLRNKSGKTVVSPVGRRSRTEYIVLRRLPSGIALIEARPETGRMHQVRVHLSHAGLPILGDAAYGRPGPIPPAPRLWLHALSIEIPSAEAHGLGIPEVLFCPLWGDLEKHLLAHGAGPPAEWLGAHPAG